MPVPEKSPQTPLRRIPIFDGHNDLATALRYRRAYSVQGLDRRSPDLQTDLQRLLEGGVGAQFWSVYVPSTLPAAETIISTLEQIDAIRRMVARYPDRLAFAVTASDVDRAVTTGRIASLLGAEGGHSIVNSLAVLRAYARLGLRYLTLTHNNGNALADSATDDARHGGLSDDGEAVVRELNRIGVLVDLSHTSEATQRDALKVSRAPVLFSHSSAYSVTAHARNVKDDVLEAVRAKHGVVQVTFVPAFVSERVREWSEEFARIHREFGGAALHPAWPASNAPSLEASRSTAVPIGTTSLPDGLRRWLDANPRPEADVADVADHVEHVREVAGLDHVGLGGDYDGIDRQPRGLEDVSGYPRLLEALSARGWSDDELAKLAFGNVRRVLQDAEDAAEEFLGTVDRS
ncbi:dipeptidase [Gulosibacter sp. 10]|uniref:dipeptidase n=1 Tax=Gulosibacter sp. 10 TaxID=1255570 RepID=UPI00097E7AD6|nr:dipeptidase [Gulosibacter sp. 10]SJM64261.1 putative dipeptidase [Gulosibacter sp. 10]